MRVFFPALLGFILNGPCVATASNGSRNWGLTSMPTPSGYTSPPTLTLSCSLGSRNLTLALPGPWAEPASPQMSLVE